MNKNSKIPRKATRLKHKSKELDSINKSHKREAYTYHEEEEEEEKERERDFTRPELQFLSPQLKEAKDLGDRIYDLAGYYSPGYRLGNSQLLAVLHGDMILCFENDYTLSGNR
ncbi:hypothetical protein F2Q69_00049879 [Brassica cretica]|uniref:Uncharacterized protein n=1 Tax=Brassica cretica TaxID=69181 RepID=A0A8S9Q8G9_BRACR|nr:hypothetical protein F2Q69_00049879 [Brassica cretica]